MRDVSKLPFIKHIEITGIYVAISFDHEVACASSVHGAAFGASAFQHLNIIVKRANGNILALLNVSKIKSEGFNEEIAVIFRTWRKHPLGKLKIVDAGNKLQKAEAADGFIGFRGVRRDIIVHNTENVEFHAVLLKYLRGFKGSFVCALALSVFSVFIVKRLCAVQRKTDETMFFI